MNDQNQQMSSTASQAKKPRTGTRRSRGRKPNKGDHSFLKAKKSTIPVPTEKENQKTFTIDWGDKNLYPYYLNFLAKSNPIHSGIIRAKVIFTVSGGLAYNGSDLNKWDKFYKNGKTDFMQKNMDELCQDISLDYEKSNMFCFLVKCNIVGAEKSYKKTERIPFEQLRFEYVDIDNKEVQLTGNIKISDNWSNKSIIPQIIKPYNGKGNQREFYVLYQEESGQSLDSATGIVVNPGFYPSPPYAGAITDIDTGIEIGKYNNAEIHNGFSLGTIISMHNGRISDANEKRKFEAGLRAAATGADQAGGIFITYGNGKEETTKVENLNGNNLADRYKNTKDGSTESTLQAHSVTVPILFSVKTEGSLGNATELEIGYNIMKKNYFTLRQNAILRPLNWIAQTFAGLKGEITFNEVLLDLPEEEKEPAFVQINQGVPQKEKQAKFSDKDIDTISQRLSEHGTPRADIKIIKSYSLADYDNVLESTAIDKFKSEFAGLTDLQAQILNLRNEGNGFDSIRKALDMSTNELANIYRNLISSELLTSDGKITELGASELIASDIEKLEVLYEYRERPDAPELVTGGKSRDFCQTLLTLNRLYTRTEIDIIAGVEGYNVFAYRGGWYTVPEGEANGGQHQPGCRHEWAQVVTLG